ncbi:hypothetical protein LWI28_008201 [Acer negundo]|uniref:Uncharacterized protein n=1 Tax=Acer negundo TaxID=4023 RepID=A0AAD5IL19_ACENE|nr:hypothetical protein LWI28_008201 [Acer negundo]
MDRQSYHGGVHCNVDGNGLGWTCNGCSGKCRDIHIYLYAEDPLLIHRWDAEFFNQISETLHQRLQHRSARAREVLTHNQLDGHTQETQSV